MRSIRVRVANQVRPLRRSGADIGIVRGQDDREGSTGLERSETCCFPAFRKTSLAKRQLVGIREHEPVTMIKAGEGLFGPDIPNILRNISLRKSGADIRGV